MTPSGSGILLVDKPAGPTSHDVVARARKLTGTRRVGHAGTLDPAATGLLVLGVNRGTKLLAFLTGLSKTYEATFRLGASTSTDDAEGETITDPGCPDFTVAELDAAMEAFCGNIDQVPATVSAIKIKGKRAHQMVRDGEEVNLPPRPVTVSAFQILASPRRVGKYLDVSVRVGCSAGTYIRSLARDLGESLGAGGHLTFLRRTAVGPFKVDQASQLTEIAANPPLLDFTAVCDQLFPPLHVNWEEAEGLRYGRVPRSPAFAAWADGEIRAATDPNGDVVALLEKTSGRLKPVFIVDPV